MDPLYRIPFTSIVADLKGNPRINDILSEIAAVEKNSLVSSSFTLRDDARVFLAINFYWIVVAPWEKAFPSRKFQVNNPNMLSEDLTEILADSMKRASAANVSEISSHMVLESVLAKYSMLKVTGFKFWEKP